MNAVPLRVGKCWFFGAVEDAASVAKALEADKPFPTDGWTVVRADNSANIYAIPEPLFEKCVDQMRAFRSTLRGKAMLLEETAFHENIVESPGKETYKCYTFGNFFGRQAVLIEKGELPAKFCAECVATKMSNVHLAFPAEGKDVTVVKWSPRA